MYFNAKKKQLKSNKGRYLLGVFFNRYLIPRATYIFKLLSSMCILISLLYSIITDKRLSLVTRRAIDLCHVYLLIENRNF